MAGKGKKAGKRAGTASGSRFELARLTDYGDAAILAELRRVAALVDRPALTEKAFAARARVSYATVRGRFGTWYEALKRAGLARRYYGPVSFGRPRAAVTRAMADEDLLDVLRRMARESGGDTLLARDMMRRGGPDVGTYARRFGSWVKAVAAAGLRHGRGARRFTNRQCFENLRDVWRFHGRQPTLDDMRRPPSTIGPAPYLQRFGGWRKALAAFARCANGRRGADFRPGIFAPAGAAPPAEPPRAEPPRRRPVPLGLRHQVLARDRYKCTACGLSPAIYQFCTLHVDHVVPLAAGGRTELANLRTLCSLCNLGKGDRPELGPAPGDPALPAPEPGLPG
jgi:hypothetical protein